MIFEKNIKKPIQMISEEMKSMTYLLHQKTLTLFGVRCNPLKLTFIGSE